MIQTKSVRRVSTSSIIQKGLIIAGIVLLRLPFFAQATTLDRELQFGMSGDDVSMLQTFLAQDSTIYPQGLVTGYFGPLTRAAVINFQARNGIATVGRVGPITMAEINAQMNSGSSVGFDRTAPTISSVSLGTTNSSATINWNTNKNTSAIVYYSTSPLLISEGGPSAAVTISGSSVLVHTDLRTVHLATLAALAPNTTYYYVIYAKDGSGNETVTTQSTFQTKN